MHGDRARRGWRERGFGLLVRLFPGRFRDEFEDEMEQVLRQDHDRRSNGAGRAGFWLASFFGALRTAPREHLSDLGLDLRYALRTLRRKPLFLVVAAVSLAIGIGATTTVVATVDAVFFEPLPGLREQGRLVNVKVFSSNLEAFDLASYPDFLELRQGSSSLEDLAAFGGTMLSLRGRPGDTPQLLLSQVVSSNFFSTLGVVPQVGRLFTDEEERVASPVAVISDWLWRTRFDRAEPLPELFLNGERFSVIGVGPVGFRGHFKGFNSDVFVPVGVGRVAGMPSVDDRSGRFLEMVGRLAPGVDLQASRVDMERRGQLLAQNYPDENDDLSLLVEPMTGIDADFRGGLALFLSTLLAISLLILLIACLNVTGMVLSRTVSRSRELAVRRVLGAPSLRLARQLLVETLVLGSIAGVLGTLLAVGATRWVSSAFASVDSRVDLDVAVDGSTILVALLLSLAVALFSGLAPGLRAARSRMADLRASSMVAPNQRWLRLLVVSQVVLVFVVLVSASLFLRALQHATAIDPGFEPARVLGVGINPRLAQMDEQAGRTLLEDLRQQAASLPGVEAVAVTNRVPLTLGARFFPSPLELEIPGWQPPADQDGFLIESAVVSEGYFATLGIPLLEGRDFNSSDAGMARGVVVVNQQFVRRFFDSGTPIGQVVRNDGEELEIVGVVRDSRYRTLDEAPAPYIYRGSQQRPLSRGVLLLRSEADPDRLTGPVRDLVSSLAPELPIQELSGLDDQMASAFLPQRVGAAAAGALGLLGLFLSAVGLYGLLGHWVGSRLREIGLRISLGATPSNVLQLVLRQGARLVLVGVLLGVPAAIACSTLLTGFLYGLSPVDPLTYAGVTAALVLTTLLASWIPARSAVGVDPLTTLKTE